MILCCVRRRLQTVQLVQNFREVAHSFLSTPSALPLLTNDCLPLLRAFELSRMRFWSFDASFVRGIHHPQTTALWNALVQFALHKLSKGSHADPTAFT
jgi:hypothetical protein